MCALLASYPHHVHTIDTLYVREGMAACHLLIENHEALMVDPGPAPACELLLQGLAELGLQPQDVRYLILTHIHLDHGGGASMLLEHCPNATLLVHANGAAHMIDPGRLIQASIEVYGKEAFTELYGEIGAIDEKRVRAVGEGFVLDFNGRPLHFFDTPGHARHHCCIWDQASKGLFSGDTCGIAYPPVQHDREKPFLIPATGPPAFEPDELIGSINRMMQLDPEYFYVTHFGPVRANPESVAILIELIEEHGRLAATENDVNIDVTCARIFDMLYDCYTSHWRKNLSKGRFNEVMAGDILLNAQGIAVRNARLKKKN